MKRYKLCFRETGKLSLRLEAEYVIDKTVRRTTKVWTIGHHYAISEYDAVTQARVELLLGELGSSENKDSDIPSVTVYAVKTFSLSLENFECYE